MISFRTKTILGIAFIETILIVILVQSSLRAQLSQSESELINRAQSISYLFATITKDAILSSDLATLEDYVREMVSNEGVVYARIRNQDGELASAGQVATRPKTMDEALDMVDDGVFDTTAPVLEAGEVFASVDIGLATDEIERSYQMALRRAIQIGIFGLLLSALFSFLLGTYLTTRLRDIRRGARAIAEGDYDAKIPEVGRDELADTARAFNLMTSKIAQNFVDIREAQKRAEQANQAKSMFLANMSHEIRTPLNAITAITSLLLKQPMKEREKIAKIKISSDSLMAQVNDILDISKIEAGEFELEAVAFSLRELLHDAASIFHELAEEKQLELVVAIPEDLNGSYSSDSHRMRQVVNNLMSNAIKFTQVGRVTLSAKILERDPKIHRLLISVKDTGIGIPEHLQKDLFTPFNQLDNSTSRKFGGTGLGLTISREIVDRMGGDLSVHSIPDIGTEFKVTVDLEYLGVETDDGTRISSPFSLPAKRVLVVEDNQMNTEVMAMILEELGQHASFASNGREGLDSYKEHDFDLVLMDFQMPVMDGFESTEAIRQYEFESGKVRTPIIAMTANALVQDRKRSETAGMDDYLTKPVSVDTVKEVLARWICGPGECMVDLPAAEPSPVSRLEGRAIDQLKILSVKKPQFWREQLHNFMATSETEADNLQAALGAKNGELVREVAHRFKSSCGIVGATKLAEICEEFEDLGASGQLDRGERLWTEFVRERQLADGEIQKMLDNND